MSKQENSGALLSPPRPAAPSTQAAGIERFFDIKRIYFEPDAMNDVAQRIVERFPTADRVPIQSHMTALQEVSSGYDVQQWTSIKREILVLGSKKSLQVYENGRSADFIAPSFANGCTGACMYCYVARNKGYGNPVTLFTNTDKIFARMVRHSEKLGPKTTPSQTDPVYWTYDVGCNSDFSADCYTNPALPDLIQRTPETRHVKLTFATKFVNRELLEFDPRGRTRIRFSLMPEPIARKVDIRTDSVRKRLAAVNDFVEAGYEVHLNFSPVIVQDGWLDLWEEFFQEIEDSLDDRAKCQAACEVIFLTHNATLHETNLQWNPKGEELLWKPELQQTKYSLHTGQRNLRYKTTFKRRYIEEWSVLKERYIPWCRTRYIF